MTDAPTAPSTTAAPVAKRSLSQHTFKVGLTAVLVVALVIRIGAAIRYDIEPKVDALDYDRHAVSIANGDGYPEALRLTGGPGPTAFRPPLYSYVLGGVYALAGTDDAGHRREAGRIAQAVLGTIAVGLIALIALQLWGRIEALVASAIAAVYPSLILAGSALLTEPLFIVLLLTGVAAILHYRDGDQRVRWLALAGAVAGFATLTRTNGVILILLFALAAWTLRPRWTWGALRAPAVVLFTAGVIIAPWTLRNALEMDSFVPVSTNPAFGLAGQYNETTAENHATWIPPFEAPEYRSLFLRPGLGEAEVADRMAAKAREYALDHPEHIVAAGFWNGLRFLSLDDPVDLERQTAIWSDEPQGLAEASVYAFWLLASLALAGCFTSAARRVPAFIWLMPPLFMLSVMFVYGLTRYRAPVEPVFVLFGTTAIVAVWQRWLHRAPRSGVDAHSAGRLET